MASFGEKLKALRTGRGLTQDTLAELLGTTKQVISRYEKNQRSPRIDIVQTYAEQLGVPIEYLLDNSIPAGPGISPAPSEAAWQAIGDSSGKSAGTINAPASVPADFVFKAPDNTMAAAHIFEGDLVYIQLGVATDDEIALLRVEDSYMLRRITHSSTGVTLRTDSPVDSPKFIPADQPAEIIGKAVYILTRAT